MLKPTDKLRKFIVLLSTWALLAGFFLAYDTYFVAGQKQFLVEREFRSLASISRKVEAEFERAHLSAESALKLGAPTQRDHLQCGAREAKDCLRKYILFYLNETLSPDQLPEEFPKCWAVFNRDKNSPNVPLEIVLEGVGLRLRFSCFLSEDPKIPSSPNPADKKPLFELNLSPWIRGALAQASDSFEDILIVDGSGRVLLEQGTSGLAISNLNSLVAGSSDITEKKAGLAFPAKDNVQDAGTSTGANSARKLTDVFERSAASRIVLGGKNYLLFSRPSHLVLGSYPSGGQEYSLLVCGLRREAVLDTESHALPYGFLIWVGLAATWLLSVSWPLFKLRYMGKTDRFSPRDAWYLSLALFLMSTAAAMMLLNASYVAATRDASEEQMKRLADLIVENFRGEIDSAFAQLRALPKGRSFQEASTSSPGPSLYGAYLNGPSGKGLRYPYFEIAFWADCRGHQVLKFDVRPAPTPAVDVSRFAFFPRIKAEILRATPQVKTETYPCPETPNTSESGKDATNDPYFEPAMSPNTDEFAPALAAPFEGNSTNPRGIWVQALVLRPISLVDPVVPPGYGFAVIDKECEVLFHSEPFRNLRENFCEESKNKTELRPWLFGGVNTFMDITYAGGTERAYVTQFPLPNLSSTGNAFLVVFEERGREVTLNLAIVLVSSILLATYFVVLAIGAAVHLSLRGLLGLRYPPRFLWPQRRNWLVYLQLFFAHTLTFALYCVASRYLYEASLLVFTLEVAFLAIAITVAQLTAPPPLLYKWGRTTAAVGASVLGLLAFSQFASSLLHRSLALSWSADWVFPFVLPTFLGAFAAVASGRFPAALQVRWTRMTQRFELVRKHFTTAYAMAAASMIVCVALVPCLGFFKYAYDAVQEISLKHDQAVLADRVVARRDRIRSYYDALEAPGFVRCRLMQTLDRYDSAFFSLKGESSITGGQSDGCPMLMARLEGSKQPPPPAKACGDSTGPPENGWNERIEKQIANLTLTFPSNEIGSEMGRLGVASTQSSDAWERSWSEPNPTCFALSGRANTRMSGLTIISSYRPWQALTPGASVYLVLLLGGLVVWILSLARQIFLTDVEIAPEFAVVHWRDASEIQTNYLVIGRTQSGKSKLLRDLQGLDPRDWWDLRVELARMMANPKYMGPSCRSSVLILDHFEFNLGDLDWNRVRLELLEGLLYQERSRVVLVSTIDPSYFFSEQGSKILSDGKDPDESARLLDRWVRALSKFTRVTLAHGGREEFVAEVAKTAEQGGEHAQFAVWVCQECGTTTQLRKVGVAILREFRTKLPHSLGQLTEIVLDRASAYYRVLWSGLTVSERLVLYQLSLDGWANPRNASGIQQLERKQMIFKAPMYRVMNNSFCRFVLSAEHADEILEWEKREQESTWHALRFVLLAVLIGGGVWLLYTQAQLFQIGTGTITAIATLLTAVAGFSARFRWSAPSEAKSEPSQQAGE
jgi:hypothetical protein